MPERWFICVGWCIQMSNPLAVTEATLHMPHGDLHPHTSHAHHYTPTTQLPHTTTTTNETTTHTPSISSLNAPHMTDTTTNTTPMPSPDPSPKPLTTYSYTTLPLPALAPADLWFISHNINTLHTMTSAELRATFDSYKALQPTIIGLQETNKNWSLYDKTEGPLWTIINQWWPGAKSITAHCKDPVFKTPHQPGGIAQFALHKITGQVVDNGCNALGCYAWQKILLNGNWHLIIITAYHVAQETVSNCGLTTSAMQQWWKLTSAGVPIPIQNNNSSLTLDLSSRLRQWKAMKWLWW